MFNAGIAEGKTLFSSLEAIEELYSGESNNKNVIYKQLSMF